MGQHPQLDPVIEQRVSGEVSTIGVGQVNVIHCHGGHHLLHGVSALAERGQGGPAQGCVPVHDRDSGLAAPDPHLVRVHHRQHQPDHEVELRGRWAWASWVGHEGHVLEAHLAEVQVRAFGLDGEHDYEKRGED